jgi:hypothetical protein
MTLFWCAIAWIIIMIIMLIHNMYMAHQCDYEVPTRWDEMNRGRARR